MIVAIPRKYADGATQDAPPKIAPATMAINGSFAPHGIKVVVMIVIRRSLSFSIVREAMIPGTPQPEPISIGIKDLPERPNLRNTSIHDEGNSCHVSASFQECQEDEQDQDLRNESENRTKTCYDTIQDQTSQPFCTADFVKYILNQNRNTWNPYAVVCRIRSCVIIFIHGCCFASWKSAPVEVTSSSAIVSSSTTE